MVQKERTSTNSWVTMTTFRWAMGVAVMVALALGSIQAARDASQDAAASRRWDRHIQSEREEAQRLEGRYNRIEDKLDRIIDQIKGHS